jgi:hypothetical protein
VKPTNEEHPTGEDEKATGGELPHQMRSQVGRGPVGDAGRRFGSNLFQQIRDPDVLGDHVVSDLGHAASVQATG